MKKEYSLGKAFDHLSEEEQAEIKALADEQGKGIDELKVERKTYSSIISKEDYEDEIAEKDEERWAVQYVSTRDVDSVGDVIIPKGVVLTDYKKTGMPVFWGHDISAPPIGSDEWIKSDQYGIKAKTNYADTGEGTIADVVWRLVKGGHQKQSSVGIIPLKVVLRGEPEFNRIDRELSSKWAEYKKNRKSVRRIIVKCMLFEHSSVGIGCNINTDVVSVAKEADMWKEEGANELVLKQAGLLIEEAEELEEVEVEETKETKEIDINESKGVKADIEREEVEEVKEVEEVESEIKRFVNVRKAPQMVKVVSLPQDEIDKQSLVDAEIRKMLGKLV